MHGAAARRGGHMDVPDETGGDANCNLGYGRFRHGYQQVTCDQERTGAICGLGALMDNSAETRLKMKWFALGIAAGVLITLVGLSLTPEQRRGHMLLNCLEAANTRQAEIMCYQPR